MKYAVVALVVWSFTKGTGATRRFGLFTHREPQIGNGTFLALWSARAAMVAVRWTTACLCLAARAGAYHAGEPASLGADLGPPTPGRRSSTSVAARTLLVLGGGED